jgi:hypothetical protein
MDASRSFAQCLEAVEEAYEFMLAYAARGAAEEDGGIRRFLRQLSEALDEMTVIAPAEAARLAAPRAAAAGDFLAVLGRDAAAALAAIRLVLAGPGIGSQMVDNLNASSHLRAVLTDLYLIESVLTTAACG